MKPYHKNEGLLKTYPGVLHSIKQLSFVHPVVSAGILGAILGSLFINLIGGYYFAWGPTRISVFNSFLVGLFLELPVTVFLGAYLGCLGWWLKLNYERAIFWMAFLSIPITSYLSLPVWRLLEIIYPIRNIWMIRLHYLGPILLIGLIVESIFILILSSIKLVKILRSSKN